MKTLYKILGLVLLLSVAVSCGKEEEDYIIPAHPVNFRVNVNVQDKELSAPTGAKVFLAPRLDGEYVGYSGLLIVCSPYTTDQLFVYDLCCTYEKKQDTKITPEGTGRAKCAKCGSVYNVLEGIGNPISGPSKENLQRYRARSSSGDAGVFYITR